jgi:hypothetical protein
MIFHAYCTYFKKVFFTDFFFTSFSNFLHFLQKPLVQSCSKHTFRLISNANGENIFIYGAYHMFQTRFLLSKFFANLFNKHMKLIVKNLKACFTGCAFAFGSHQHLEFKTSFLMFCTDYFVDVKM